LPPAFQLLIERTIDIPDDDPGHSLQKHPVLLGEAVDMSHEHTTRLVHQLGLGAGGDEPQDLVVENAPVSRGILVPDHQVGQQATRPPVGMRPEQVADQVQIVGVAHAKQNDREIARDAVSPEPQLVLAVTPQDAARGTVGADGEDHGGRQLPVVLGFGFARSQVAQDSSAVRRRDLEHAVGHPVILVF